MRDVPNDAHNFPRRLVARKLQTFPQHVSIREEAAHKCPVDDHHPRRAGVVALIKPSPGNQRNAHSREIAGRGLTELGVVEFTGTVTVSRNMEEVIAVLPAERQLRSRAYCFNSWKCFHLIFELPPKSRALLRIAIAAICRLVQSQPCCYHVLSLKAGVHVNQPPEAPE